VKETSIVYDYEISEVRIFTDREGVKNGILRRLGQSIDGLRVTGENPWFISIPMKHCRGAEMLCRLLNDDERSPMSEEQKAALRAVKS
jgi:hypothetical protein